MNIAETLKYFRRNKNLSQEKLAEELGISRQAVSKWEDGAAEPDTKNLIKLAEIFNVPLNELTGLPEVLKKPETSENNMLSIPRFVVLAYILNFASIIGFFCPPISNVPYPYRLWIGVGFIGGIMLVIKNKKLKNSDQRQWVQLMDIGIILLGITLGAIIPNEIGLVKSLIIATPLAIYMRWISKKYFLNEEMEN